MSDKEIQNYQNSSRKRPQKNYRSGLGDYSCTPGCQSASYDANVVKIALLKKCLQVIKRYKCTGGADKFSKTKKVMVCEFHFNPKQIRVSLGIGRKRI